jgi:hypothetical protein
MADFWTMGASQHAVVSITNAVAAVQQQRGNYSIAGYLCLVLIQIIITAEIIP